jgi:hypothetical protein
VKGDFSRISFSARKHFSQVLLQQGRVLLDADFNEQGAIVANALRQLTRDLLGPHAGPEDGLGFRIGNDSGRIIIGPGRYFVDGLLASNTPFLETGSIAPLFYDTQPGYPFPGSVEAANFELDKPYFLYLDVWEREVTWLDDGSLREVALGGPDTAVRAQVVWQVRAVEHQPPVGVFNPEAWLEEHLQRHHWETINGARLPQMKAWTDSKSDSDRTPCTADPLGGYIGLENQHYRVEIHQDGLGGRPITFKLSRDNGGVAGALVEQQGNDLVVHGARNGEHAFAPGQWIELTDEVDRLNSRPGIMMRLVKVHRERLTFDPATESRPPPPLSQLSKPVIRRWDHRESRHYELNGGAIVLEPDKTYPVERGIQISFRKAATGSAPAYRSGDFWLIPARATIGDIEWPSHTEVVDGQPRRAPDFVEPDGVHHAYAPLALVTKTSGAGSPVTINLLQRKINQLWTPL